MKIYVSDKETGTFITEVKSIEEGKRFIEECEEQDRQDNNYTPNFYDIVNEKHISIL